MWVRGLKLCVRLLLDNRFRVAPHVGAWIETLSEHESKGAVQSHPMWVRGLKHWQQFRTHLDQAVAPHVGAWIETT